MRLPCQMLRGGIAAAAVVVAGVVSAAAQAPDQAVFAVTYIEVAPSGEAQAANLLKTLAAASRKEAGNLRYEILAQLDESSHFAVLEAWSEAKAREAHAGTPAMKQFRDALKPLQAANYDERPSIATPLGFPGAAGSAGAVYILTHVDIAGQNNRDEANATLKKMAEDARKEGTAQRFEVWQQANRANHFTVNEVWKDNAAYGAHLEAATTRANREKLGPMLGALYDVRRYKALD
jgi:quinol monooxygenase YgiN